MFMDKKKLDFSKLKKEAEKLKNTTMDAKTKIVGVYKEVREVIPTEKIGSAFKQFKARADKGRDALFRDIKEWRSK